MNQAATSRTRGRRIVRSAAFSLAVVTVAIVGILASRPESSSAGIGRGDPGGAPDGVGGALTEDDGVLPDGVTVFDDEYPGIAQLDPALLDALRAAARAAGRGVPFVVNSGWRSPAYQDRLLRQAIATYGSERAAERWVATAGTSPHVAGDAVDVGDEAASWLSRHGARYGLCQVYRNEPWHFELRPNAIGHGCPAMYADPTRDPRMDASRAGGTMSGGLECMPAPRGGSRASGTDPGHAARSVACSGHAKPL